METARRMAPWEGLVHLEKVLIRSTDPQVGRFESGFHHDVAEMVWQENT